MNSRNIGILYMRTGYEDRTVSRLRGSLGNFEIPVSHTCRYWFNDHAEYTKSWIKRAANSKGFPSACFATIL